MKKGLFVLVVFLMVVGVLSLSWAAEKPIVLKWANYAPKTELDPQAITVQWFANQWEERTNRRVKVVIYWGGTLAGIMEVPWAVRDGVGDIGTLITPYFPDHFPLNAVGTFVVPMRLTTLELGQTMFSLHEKYPQYVKEFTEKNLKCIGFRPLESYGILSKKPIRKLADMKGMKVRNIGAGWVPFITAAGGIPVSMATPEMYEAMERGVLDASPIGITLANRWKIDRVAKYFSFPLGAIMGHCLIMNLKSFNNLPPDIQTITMKLGRDYLDEWVKTLDIQVEKVKEIWKKTGVEIVPITPEDLKKTTDNDLVRAIYKDWINRAKAKGVPDPEKIIEQFIP